MSTTQVAAASTPIRTPSRNKKSSKIVVLRIAAEKLSLLTQTPAKSKSRSKPVNGTTSSDTKPAEGVSTPGDSASDANNTPLPSDEIDASKKRKSPDDTKETDTPKEDATKEDNSTPKPRGKPGPKRRKVENENGQAKPTTAAAPAASHKLGPKANQGAINAGLRALDRTGKPSRRWHRRGFMLKSFTGVSWALPCWETPKLSTVESNGDLKSDTPSSGDANKQGGPNGSVGGSEKSNDNARLMAPPPLPNGHSNPSKAANANHAAESPPKA